MKSGKTLNVFMEGGGGWGDGGDKWGDKEGPHRVWNHIWDHVIMASIIGSGSVRI